MQQAITRANVDPDLCRHMASLSHNGYYCRFLLRIVTGTLVSILRNIMVRTNMLIAYANFMNDTKIYPMRLLNNRTGWTMSPYGVTKPPWLQM